MNRFGKIINIEFKEKKYQSKSNSPEKDFRAQEERRVLFIGRVLQGTTKKELIKKFRPFCRIVSMQYQEHTDNFAYVTFTSSADAYQAVVHGKDPSLYSILCYDRRQGLLKRISGLKRRGGPSLSEGYYKGRQRKS
ncbi:nuclear receptor transcription coactivator activity protein [Homalodisca vitripennis]|nr:nuclear receptor transcription coactivator activity protein [Homalodisca vitripennis]